MMPIDTLQWLRRIEVIVGKDGKGLHIIGAHNEGLHVEATVEKTIRHTPNTADITIINLDPESEHKVLQEYDDIIVSAGYEGAVLLIFRGNIKHAVAYWDQGARKVDIQAADGDKDYRTAVMQSVVRSDAEAVQAALRAMPNTKPGHIKTGDKRRIRAKVISGAARDVLHQVAADNDANWSIQDGALQIVESTGVLPTEAIVMNEQTGLIGAPELSDKGIRVTSHLNPYVAINGKLLLNNDNIKIETKQLYTTGPKVKTKKLVRLSTDGVYKVFKIRHEIDSRGPSKTISECVTLGDAIPSTGTKKAVVKL
jgi:hypothetical protein